MSWFLHFTWQVVWGGDAIIFLTNCYWQRCDVLWSPVCPGPQTHRAGAQVFGDTSNIWRGDEHGHMSSATATPWHCGNRNIWLLFHEELPQTIRFEGKKPFSAVRKVHMCWGSRQSSCVIGPSAVGVHTRRCAHKASISLIHTVHPTKTAVNVSLILLSNHLISFGVFHRQIPPGCYFTVQKKQRQWEEMYQTISKLDCCCSMISFPSNHQRGEGWMEKDHTVEKPT